LEENKERWKVRKKLEEQGRLETEKQDRLEKSRQKKQQPGRKECSRRLEEKKRLEGKQKMKSDLWKQRRERDGRLVTVWKEIKNKTDITLDTSSQHSYPSQVEEDHWMEEITLTDQERIKLEEFESSILNNSGADLQQGTSSPQVGPVTSQIMPPTDSLGSSYVRWSVPQPASPTPHQQLFPTYKINGPQTPEDQDEPEHALISQGSSKPEQAPASQGSSDSHNPPNHEDENPASQESSHLNCHPEQKTPEDDDADEQEQATNNPRSSTVPNLVSHPIKLEEDICTQPAARPSQETPTPDCCTLATSPAPHSAGTIIPVIRSVAHPCQPAPASPLSIPMLTIVSKSVRKQQPQTRTWPPAGASSSIPDHFSQPVSRKQPGPIPDIVSQSVSQKQPPARTWPPVRTKTPPSTATYPARTSTMTTLRSCSKTTSCQPVVWQELKRENDGKINMICVEDFGLRLTTRRKKIETQTTKNQPTQALHELETARVKKTSPVQTESAKRRLNQR
jgi:hypothetical protein